VRVSFKDVRVLCDAINKNLEKEKFLSSARRVFSFG
jgi:hypothetical protein